MVSPFEGTLQKVHGIGMKDDKVNAVDLPWVARPPRGEDNRTGKTRQRHFTPLMTPKGSVDIWSILQMVDPRSRGAG